MRRRYLVAVGEDPESRCAIKARLSAEQDARLRAPAAETGPLLLFATAPDCDPASPEWIRVDGTFERGASPFAGPSRETSIAVSLDGERGEAVIKRAPFGDLPCFWARREGATFAASDPELLIAAGLARPSIDPVLLARHLAAEDLRRSDTCLGGLFELRGGSELSITKSHVDVRQHWSPSDFTAPDAQIGEKREAVQALREAALASVSAAASLSGRVLLKLSGGLDSSLVGAFLKASGRSFLCLTLATEDPAGDERRHARATARALGAELLERFRVASRVDLLRSAAWRLPRPSARAFTQESTRIAAEAARDHHCGAVFDGGGGDNLFCSLQSARPAADCLMSARGGRQFVATIVAIAGLSEASIWDVASRAWRISRHSSPAYVWALDRRFLTGDASREAAPAAEHPWLDAPPGALPGKAAHLALIAAAQSVAEGFDPLEEIPTFSPLISRPLVETCLRIPSWMWFSPRGNRAVAREALSDLLPDEVAWRRSKGAPDSFIATIFEANRETIRTMLLGGVLEGLRLLDRPALKAFLDDETPVKGHDYLRVMQLVDAEAWARNWV